MNQLIYQIDDDSCSLASFQMLLVMVGHNKAYAHAKISAHHPPYSLEELKEGAKTYGFTLNFYKIETHEIAYPNNQKGPFLVLFKTEQGGTHLVVVKSISNHYVHYLDPALGTMSLKKEEFLKKWNGIYGVASQDEVAPYPRPELVDPVKSKPILGVSFFFLLLAEASLFAGFYFVSKEGNILYPILFFSLFALSEIARQLISLYYLRRFDKKWLEETYDPSPTRMKSNYEHYCAYKKYLLASPISAFSALISSLGIVILVGFNTPSFFLSCGILSIFTVLGSGFLAKEARQDTLSLVKEERSLYASGTRQEKIASLSTISSKATHYGERLVYSRIIMAFLILFLAFIPLISSQNITLNFYLFHCFALLVFAEGLKGCLEYLLAYPETSAEEGYFYEYFVKKKR